jgi:hypothetical protein
MYYYPSSTYPFRGCDHFMRHPIDEGERLKTAAILKVIFISASVNNSPGFAGGIYKCEVLSGQENSVTFPNSSTRISLSKVT